MSDFLLIIDGSSLLTTQFFGNLPREIMFAKTMEEKAVYFPKIMKTSTGIYTNAVYGFVRVLLKIIKEQQPAYLAVAWDVSRDTFRRELYPDYKGNRGETMPPLKEQFVLCQEVLQRMGVRQFMDNRYEADDFSGTLTHMFEQQIPVRIMTKDHDYLQLVSEHTQLWMIHSTAKKTEELYEKYHMRQRDYAVPDRTFPFDPQLVEQEFGVRPESVNSLKGLQGDASDNIKGVPGVGEMTAIALIHEYGSVEKLYEVIHQADEAGKKKLAEFWKKELGIKRSPMGALTKESDTELVGEKAAMLSKALATIKQDIPLELSLEELRLKIDREAAAREFERLEFRSLKIEEPESVTEDFVPVESNPFDNASGEYIEAADVPFGMEAMPEAAGTDADREKEEKLADGFEVPHFETAKSNRKKTVLPAYTEASAIVNVTELTDTLLSGKYLAFQVLATEGELLKAAFQNDAGTVYCGVPTSEAVLEFLEKAANQGMLLVTSQLKEQLNGMDAERLYQLAVRRCLVDTDIAAYLLNPLAASHGYAELAEQLYHIQLPKKQELLKKLAPREAVLFEGGGVNKLLALQTNSSWLLAEYLLETLKAEGMEELFYGLEMPLLFTLYHMQERGIRVQKQELADYGATLFERIKVLEEMIYEQAGEIFNINSPKQLGVILFEKLQLPGGRKTKTGYSTAADVLENLSGKHSIADMILEYRQLTKLKSTYADGLANFICEDGRIHGCFNQTVTATGRISSTEPNLQNIPIRMELGRQLRRVFVPEEGFLFLDADYSQIELRVLAHMSDDKRLIAAYNEAQDIHQMTASQVFHTPFDEVTKEQRSRAKAVNFGIVYGISSFGLGQGLHISRHEAEEYMTKYFETYPGVKQFMDQLVAEGREQGKTRTVFGRIRPLPDITSTSYVKRNAEERVAMNAPIQGTAADIIKIAMLRVDRRLIEEGCRSRLLLQIHDELLIETAVEEVEQVRRILIEEMRGAATLAVPLEVSAEQGSSWLEAH